MELNIIDQIMQIKDVLPKKQRQLCNFLVLHYVDAGMMTVAELAEHSQVGTTTVLRLMKALGFKNYSDFKHELLNVSLMRTASSYRGMKQRFQPASEKNNSDAMHALWRDFSHISGSILTPQNIQQLTMASKMMLDASCIYVLGLRSSRTPAIYLESTLSRFYSHVRLMEEHSEYLFDRALSLEQQDILVIFSVWPCTKMTIEVADLVHQKGIKIVLITNTQLNPIAKYAEIVIDTNSVNSNSGCLPVMFIAEALVAELGRLTAPESTERIESLERQLEALHVFIKERTL